MKKVFCAIVALMIALTSCKHKDGTRIARTKDGKFAISEIGGKTVGTYDSIAFLYQVCGNDSLTRSGDLRSYWEIKQRTCDISINDELDLEKIDSTGRCSLRFDGKVYQWTKIARFRTNWNNTKQIDGVISSTETSSIFPVMITYKNMKMGVHYGTREVLPCAYQNIEFVGDYIVVIPNNESWMRKIYYAPFPYDTVALIGELQRCDERARDILPLFRNRNYVVYNKEYYKNRTCRYIICDDVLGVTVKDSSGANKEGVLYKSDGYFHFVLNGREITDTNDVRYPIHLCDHWTATEADETPAREMSFRVSRIGEYENRLSEDKERLTDENVLMNTPVRNSN